MAHLTYKPKDVWEPNLTLTVEERVDLLYAEIIQGVFEDFYNSGPGDFIVDFGITREEFEIICQDDLRGGLDGFQERVLDVLEVAIKDISIFNGQPTSDKTIITNIFDIVEFVDDDGREGDVDGYAYDFRIGLRRENDE